MDTVIRQGTGTIVDGQLIGEDGNRVPMELYEEIHLKQSDEECE